MRGTNTMGEERRWEAARNRNVTDIDREMEDTIVDHERGEARGRQRGVRRKRWWKKLKGYFSTQRGKGISHIKWADVQTKGWGSNFTILKRNQFFFQDGIPGLLKKKLGHSLPFFW